MARAPVGAARAIYGQILVLSVVAAFSEDPGLDSWEVLGAVVATMVVFWTAHVYSEALARRVNMKRNLRVDEMVSLARDELPLIQAALPIAGVLALGAVGLYATDTAVDLALIVGIAGLAGWGLQIGRRSGFGWQRTLLEVALNCTFGLVIVGLKILIH